MISQRPLTASPQRILAQAQPRLHLKRTNLRRCVRVQAEDGEEKVSLTLPSSRRRRAATTSFAGSVRPHPSSKTHDVNAWLSRLALDQALPATPARPDLLGHNRLCFAAVLIPAAPCTGTSDHASSQLNDWLKRISIVAASAAQGHVHCFQFHLQPTQSDIYISLQCYSPTLSALVACNAQDISPVIASNSCCAGSTDHS